MNKSTDAKKEDFEALYEHVKDMRESAEAIGTVLIQIKDNDVSFNERLMSLETKYERDIHELSEKLATFFDDLDVLKTTMRQIGETQNAIQSNLLSANFFKPIKRNLSSRKNSNSEEGIRIVNSNGVSNGEDDSGVNLGAPICSSTTSDHGSNRSHYSRENSMPKNSGADAEFVKERINQFIEAASNLCNNSSVQDNFSSTSNGEDFSPYTKLWPATDSKMPFRGPLETRRAISNDSNENYRYQLCLELVQCERALCNDISTVQLYYYEPLKCATNEINSRDLSLMFPSELFRLYEQHCTILHKVQEIINDYCDSWELMLDVYAKVFEPRGYLICLYSDYISSYRQIMKSVSENFNENSDCVRFLIRYNSTSGLNPRQKLIHISTLQNYLAAPLKMIRQYNNTFKRFLETDLLPESTTEKLETLLETLKHNWNEDQMLNDPSSVLVRIPITPPLKPLRTRQAKKTKQPLQHSSSDAVIPPYEKKPLFERHNCPSVSRKHQKLRMSYSGSEVNLHRADSIELPKSLGSPKLLTQLDAISEPSIFHDVKQTCSVRDLHQEDCNFGLLSSQSQQMLARSSAQVGLGRDSSKFVKRNRNSLVKQVGGFRNSVAAFFSKRKNERRFSEVDSTSSNSASTPIKVKDKKLKKSSSKDNLNFNKFVESQQL